MSISRRRGRPPFLVIAVAWASILWSRAFAATVRIDIELNASSTSSISHNATSNLTLRVGVAAGAPMTVVAEDGSLAGFQIDLLDSIRGLAEKDGVHLNVELTDLRAKYPPAVAFHLVAKDCLSVIKNKTDCGRYDLIMTPIFSTPERFAKADLTPPFLQDYISAIRYSGAPPPVYSTFGDLERVNGTYCSNTKSAVMGVLKDLYPNLNILQCKGQGCIGLLKKGDCSLQAHLRYNLVYQALQDSTLIQTREAIGRNFIIWPMNDRLDPEVRRMFKEWMYRVVIQRVPDQLLKKYYEPKICPLGLAGDTCADYCDPDHGRSDRLGKCICDSTRYIGEDCATEVVLDAGMIPDYQIAIGYTMFGVNVLVVFLCGLWLLDNRKAPYVQAAQPFFLALVLLGCLISSSTILAFMQQAKPDHSHNSCMLIPWLYSVGFSITFGTLFTKIYRVHKLVKYAMRMRRAQVTLLSALRWIAVVLCVDMAILIVWQVVDPLQWTRKVTTSDKFGAVLASVGMCTSEHWKGFAGAIGAFHFLLIAVASYMCYTTRKIPNSLSGAKGVYIAMISNLQIFLVGVPVLLLIGSDPETSFFLRSVMVWMNDLVVVVAVFGDLMYGNDVSDSDSVRSIVSSAVSDIARMNRSNMDGSGRSHRSRSSRGLGKRGSSEQTPQ